MSQKQYAVVVEDQGKITVLSRDEPPARLNHRTAALPIGMALALIMLVEPVRTLLASIDNPLPTILGALTFPMMLYGGLQMINSDPRSARHAWVKETHVPTGLAARAVVDQPEVTLTNPPETGRLVPEEHIESLQNGIERSRGDAQRRQEELTNRRRQQRQAAIEQHAGVNE